MSADVFIIPGVVVSCYVGPAREDGGPRTRWQIGNSETGQVLSLSNAQWTALFDRIRSEPYSRTTFIVPIACMNCCRIHNAGTMCNLPIEVYASGPIVG